MKLIANMGSRSKGQSEVPPDGTHLVEVLRMEKGQSKVKKTDQLYIQLEVAEGPYQGMKMNDYIPLLSSCEFRISNFLFACGYDGDSEVEVNTDEVVRYSGEQQINSEGALVLATKKSDGKYYDVTYLRPKAQPQAAAPVASAPAATPAPAAAPAPVAAPAPAAAPAEAIPPRATRAVATRTVTQ